MSAQTIKFGQSWDCIVIGAGPAGSIAARQIAQKNKTVLLIDKEKFPRTKVCGCCINANALNILNTIGLEKIMTDNGALSLSKLRVFNNKKSADISFLKGFVLSRQIFDLALVEAGIDSGVKFLSEASAKVIAVDSLPVIQIKKDDKEEYANAKVVIVADGLSGRSLDLLPQFVAEIAKKSRFGASVILNETPDYIEPGNIYMACGNGGYVGMVMLEDGRLNLAAALDQNFSRQFNSPGKAVAELLRENNLALPNHLVESQWKGTHLLTRRRQKVSGERLFIIGDACGYAEPFTGEGMAWALSSGLAVSELAIKGTHNWTYQLEKEWTYKQSQLNAYKRRSQFIALALRNNMFRDALIKLNCAAPAMLSRIAQMIAGSSGNAVLEGRYEY